MSLMRRIWNAMRNSARFVGKDLEGNTYFESRSYNDPSRTKRTVQYRDSDDMWKYIGGGKRLPVQWSSWLTHTRPHPPTLQELEADLNRQRRVLANAQMIEAKDQAEAENMKRIRQQEAHMAIEDAVNMRNPERTRWETGSKTAAPEPTLEAQGTPSQVFRKVLPPKFLTPPTPRKARTNPFTVSSLLDPSATESSFKDEGESIARTQPQNTSPWKTTSTETESWTPKARQRG